MRACSLLGHSYRFTAEGETMRWACERGAARAAASATRPRRTRSATRGRSTSGDAEKLGKRPLLSLLPLWLARKAGDRASRRR